MLPVLFLCVVTSAAAALPRCPAGGAEELVLEAEIALARSEWPRAASRLGCAAQRSSEVALAERATRTAFEYQQPAAAVVSARRWLALDPESETARRHFAIALLRDYDDPAAASEFAPLLDLVDRARAYEQLLGVLAAERNVTGAARVMDRLAATDPDLPEARYAASVLWQRADHGGRALAEARGCAHAAPGLACRAVLRDARPGDTRPARRGTGAIGGADGRWRSAGAARSRLAAARFGPSRRGRRDVWRTAARRTGPSTRRSRRSA